MVDKGASPLRDDRAGGPSDPSPQAVSAVPALIPSAGHTPGPWRVAGDYCIVGPDDGPIPHYSGWVEEAWSIDAATDESIANSYLIAAAPELLEALREFSREYDGFENGDGKPCPTLKKARAAIAKATGA